MNVVDLYMGTHSAFNFTPFTRPQWFQKQSGIIPYKVDNGLTLSDGERI